MFISDVDDFLKGISGSVYIQFAKFSARRITDIFIFVKILIYKTNFCILVSIFEELAISMRAKRTNLYDVCRYETTEEIRKKRKHVIFLSHPWLP